MASAALFAASAAAGQPAARTEIHPVPSTTLTTTQVLTGATTGTPVMLAGELRLPKSAAARMPLVILVHGSGGIGPNIDAWAEDINGLGVAAFIFDSFTGRGIVDTISDQTQLDSLAMIADVYRALAVLSKHPRIDPQRIAVMGFSKGAVGAIYAADLRFRRLYDPAGPGLAAHIGFYTPCNMQLDGDEATTGAPIRLFHGAPDDWVPAAPCRDYVARLRKAGADATLTEYPGAWHAFDNAARSPPVILANAQTARDCHIKEAPGGQLLNVRTGAVFTYGDSCIERGAHVGFDPAAYAASRTAVLDFLKATLKP